MRHVFLAAVLILAMLSFTVFALADTPLKGYVPKEGYTYVTLGNYMQTVDGGSPDEKNITWTWSRNPIKDTTGMTFDKTPILWRVLTVDDEKAYLASEYVLFAMPMHRNVTEYKSIGKDFGQTELCAYLNNEFAREAFTQDELEMLLPHESYGKVFLLDSVDVKDKAIGFGSGQGMKGWGTEYAIRVTHLFVYRPDHGSHSPYWVRTQSTSDRRHARCTKQEGALGHIISDRDNEGARPAVYLDINSFAIAGGSGTKADPYMLTRKGADE